MMSVVCCNIVYYSDAFLKLAMGMKLKAARFMLLKSTKLDLDVGCSST